MAPSCSPRSTRALIAALLLGSLAAACAEDRPINLPPPSRPDRATGDGGLDASALDGEPAPDARPGRDALPGFDASPDPSDASPGPDGRPVVDAGQPEAGQPDGGQRAVDLSIEIAAPIPTHIAPGGSVTLIIEVTNLGTQVAAPSEVAVDLRALAAGTMPVMLTQVGVRSLAARDTETLTMSLVIPAALMPDSYLLRARVDPQNLVVESDESNNSAEVVVSGSGLDVSPASLMFGAPVECEAADQMVTVRNVGGIAATIDSVAIVGSPEFGLAPLPLPATLQPGGSLALSIGYAPVDVGNDAAHLDVSFVQSSRSIVMVPLSGEGRPPQPRTDVFQQPAVASRLDLLMVIDNSCSMSEEQQRLASEAPTFLSWAQANGIDFHIAVVTTDMFAQTESGRIQGMPSVLTPNTTNLSQTFAAHIQRGTNGSADERGVDAMLAALTPPLENTHNQGFLRPDAVLGVLVLSDEEDSSTVPVATAISTLQAVKPTGVIRVNAIVTPAGGCSTGATAGLRYISVAQAFNGTVDSICNTSWTTPLTTWGMVTTIGRRFTLTQPARAAGIVVRVNGTVVPGGAATWTFDASANAVVFMQGAAPGPGATVEVAYTEGCGP